MTTRLVYAVYKNGDMTEGRGPMVLESIWETEEAAWTHANRQLGVMGRKPTQFHRASPCPTCGARYEECPGWNCKVCWKYGGDWKVESMELQS